MLSRGIESANCVFATTTAASEPEAQQLPLLHIFSDRDPRTTYFRNKNHNTLHYHALQEERVCVDSQVEQNITFKKYTSVPT